MRDLVLSLKRWALLLDSSVNLINLHYVPTPNSLAFLALHLNGPKLSSGPTGVLGAEPLSTEAQRR